MRHMTIQIEAAGPGGRAHHDGPPRNLWRAMLNGVRMACPACGKGRLFPRYLKVADHCPACGEALHHQRADDAPPYFTMLIVGHVLVGGALSLERAFAPPMWVHMAIWLPLTLLMSLWLLPHLKGALVGLQWAHRMHGFGLGADPAEPDDVPQPRAAGGSAR